MNDRRNLVIAIIASFVFGLSGGVIASIALITFLHGGPRFDAPAPPAPPGPGMHGPLQRMLAEELDLTDEQQARVEEILARTRPMYAAVRESTHAEIERLLTPEQRRRWRDHLEHEFRRGRRAPRRQRDF